MDGWMIRVWQVQVLCWLNMYDRFWDDYKDGWLRFNGTINLYSAIHVGSCWFMLENMGEKANLKKQKIHKLNTTQKIYQCKYSKIKLPSLVAFYDTRPRNKVGLFYNTQIQIANHKSQIYFCPHFCFVSLLLCVSVSRPDSKIFKFAFRWSQIRMDDFQ